MDLGTSYQFRAIPSLTGTPPALDIASLPQDPLTLFEQWFRTVLDAEVPEPLAVTVATVDGNGMPDARTLMLKDVSERGWAFAGTASSRKGRQLESAPYAAMNLWWQPVMRAVRVQGPVEQASAAECAADLAARSASARAGVDAADWRLWRIRPTRIEFWQGSTDRQHTRIVYRRDNDSWQREVAHGDNSLGQSLLVGILGTCVITRNRYLTSRLPIRRCAGRWLPLACQ